MRAVLYTAIYGQYDHPKPLPVGLDVAAVLYTDSQETAELAERHGWEPRVVEEPRPEVERREPHAMLRHKWWKTHPLQAVDADVSLWIDGSMTVLYPDYGARCLAALGGDDWAVVPHPWRDCIYDEAAYSLTVPRYQSWPLTQQVEEYRRQYQHPERWGLIATGANARRHTTSVESVSAWWWNENVAWSHQDQLSIPVAMRLSQQAGTVRWNWNLPWASWWALDGHVGAGV